MAEALKNHFDRAYAQFLSTQVARSYPEFPAAYFTATLRRGVPPLGLEDRINLAADGLRAALSDDYGPAKLHG